MSEEEVRAKIDAVVSSAYRAASARFPCRVKSSGKPKMLRWQEVGKCLNYAHDRVDWDDVSEQLQAIRRSSRFQSSEILALAESALAAQALPYEKVFIVKDKAPLLPLSSSLLKFLPEGSLLDLPVFDRKGKQLGTFSGIYSFEKAGDISGTRNRLVLFQYTDAEGKIHSTPEKLLLDNFGVPYKDAASQLGFRLPADRLVIR